MYVVSDFIATRGLFTLGILEQLDDWRRGMQVGDTWVTSSQVTATGVKSAWRVPTFVVAWVRYNLQLLTGGFRHTGKAY